MSEERIYLDPDINMETEAYWAGCNDGKLLLKKCDDCGETHFYPRAICPHCMSDNTSWYEASGKGKIYSYAPTRRVKVPYIMAYITLEEGVTMMSNIVDADPDSLSIDQAVEVTFHKTEGGQALPVFRPLDGAA